MNVASKVQTVEGPKQPKTVDFYHESPEFELTLDEFEVFALQRLKILRKIEQLKTMGAKPDILSKKIVSMIGDLDNDVASHFILRLSYCQNEDLRRWFLTHECDLFKYRLKSLSDTELANNVKQHCDLSPMSSSEKDEMADALQALVTNPAEFLTSKYYKVPFTQVLDLVSTRQCVVRAGLAYVPESKVISILVSQFRSHLSKSLALMIPSYANLNQTQDPEAQRIHPLLANMKDILVHTEVEQTQNSIGGSLHAANVNKYKANMPLCMRELQNGLLADKKLKHWGRLQYGLFLKGAGLSMEEALQFFQKHFSLVTGEKFQKEYAYNIRHMYGKEGKRTNYTPYNCSKIILGNAPSAGDHHGCPYKHYDDNHLKSLLQRLKIGDSKDRAEIMNLKRSHNYQLACQKHFNVMHPDVANSEVNLDGVGNHPNAWFRASVAHSELHAPKGNQVSP